MNKTKNKNHEWRLFFDRSTFLLCVGTVLALDAGFLPFCVLFVHRAVSEQSVGTDQIGNIASLVLFGGYMLVVTGSLFHRKGFGKVNLLWCADAEGIHCKGIGWPSFSFRWDEIKFIAVSQYMYGLYEHFAIAFCLDSEYHGELVPKYRQSADEHCIIFDYTPEVWAELKDNLPDDVARRMQEALDKHKSVYIRKGGKQ